MMGSRGLKGARENDALSHGTRRMRIRRQAIRAAKRTFNKRARKDARHAVTGMSRADTRYLTDL